MILDYFTRVKTALNHYEHLISDLSSVEKTYSNTKGFISGQIVFFDNSQLDFAEVKDTESESKKKYRYHYMDKDNNLIFRYDNAKHYPNLATFPHHKHTIQGVKESKEPNLEEVLLEIESMIVSIDKI